MSLGFPFSLRTPGASATSAKLRLSIAIPGIIGGSIGRTPRRR